ncbi:hypothetical protein V2G26_006226 [Clonostachys chloroleuca]
MKDPGPFCQSIFVLPSCARQRSPSPITTTTYHDSVFHDIKEGHHKLNRCSSSSYAPSSLDHVIAVHPCQDQVEMSRPALSWICNACQIWKQ